MNSKNRILYFGDPMCSWCYAFSSVLETIRSEFSSDFSFTLVVGGLRVGDFAEKVSLPMARSIQSHWTKIRELTNLEFDPGLLESGEFVYNTEPACQAIVAMRNLSPESAFPFKARLSEAFFKEARDITQSSVLLELAAEFEVSPEEFHEQIQRKENSKETLQDFFFSHQLGIRGFPTLLYSSGQNFQLITSGYQNLEVMRQIFSILKNKLGEEEFGASQ